MDLTTTYMGLTLTSPVIAGASKITGSVDGVRQCAEAGAGAVVLKSIFEEQILIDAEQAAADGGEFVHAEAAEYLRSYGRESAVGEYLDLIAAARGEVSIPVIASVHCVSAGGWTEFARRAERAGAAGLELNVYLLPSDIGRDGRAMEQAVFDIATTVKRQVSIPVALKVGSTFSAMAHTLLQLSQCGVDGLVLFNRFYQPDVDIEAVRFVPARYLSRPEEIALPLRWVGLLSDQAGCSLAASTGVHDAAGLVKMLLVGADAVQVASTLYLHGVERIAEMNDGLRDWMARHDLASLDAVRGRLGADRTGNPAALERVQFMRSVSGIE